MKTIVFVLGLIGSAMLLSGCSEDDGLVKYEFASWDWALNKRTVKFPTDGGAETLTMRGNRHSFMIADVYDESSGEPILQERTQGWPLTYDNGWMLLECSQTYPHRELNIKVDGKKHPEPYKFLVLFGDPQNEFKGSIVIQSEGWNEEK